MSLKAKITLLTIAVTTTIVAALFAVQLNNVVESWLAATHEIAELAGQQVKQVLIVRLQERVAGRQPSLPPPRTWRELLARDQTFASLLEATMARTHALVEISVTDRNGAVLASSNPLRPGTTMPYISELRQLQQMSPLRRGVRVLRTRSYYQVRIPLGFQDESEPVFTIHVLASPVLLRQELVPALRRVAGWGAAAVAAGIALAWLSARLVTSNLVHLSAAIDRIRSGEQPDQQELARTPPREFAALESKLNLLGHQFRGAADAMTRITSSIAHEIKNPLNSIAIRLDNLQAAVSSELPEAEEDIQQITDEIHRLDRVVRTFLDFTRPVKLTLAKTDIVGLCREVVQLLEPDASRRGIQMQFASEREPLFISADRDLIKEAIINIVTNGLEAMPEGGLLRVGVAELDRSCVIEVVDSGAGIPPAIRDKIFDLHFTTKKNGSGLGLPMAARAVQLHGGMIEVNSTVGKGTKIHLSLPKS